MADDAVPLTEPRWTYQAGDTDIPYLPHMITCLLESEVKSLSRVRLFVTPWTVARQVVFHLWGLTESDTTEAT